jgi:hypothetical protein
MHVSEDAARFLHQACRGLPRRINGGAGGLGSRQRKGAIDAFYACVIEHAVAFFGSRVLYPARPAADLDDAGPLSRAGCEKAAQSAARGDECKFETSAREWGYRIGSQIYDAYLAGKVAPSRLRRLFLAHLGEPGAARKVCTAVIARLTTTGRGTS